MKFFEAHQSATFTGKVLNINSLAMEGERKEKLTYPYGYL